MDIFTSSLSIPVVAAFTLEGVVGLSVQIKLVQTDRDKVTHITGDLVLAGNVLPQSSFQVASEFTSKVSSQLLQYLVFLSQFL